MMKLKYYQWFAIEMGKQTKQSILIRLRVYFVIQKSQTIADYRNGIINFCKMANLLDCAYIKLFILLIVFESVFGSLTNRLRFFQYCTYYNYPVEQHIIQTQDNVNLKYYRIQTKNSTIVPGKKVVYLQHGLIDSADTFIMNDEHSAPAFVLANKGYDVWLGNIRGNRYSNAALSPFVINYWDFTFDQMAKYDLAASFRYIANKTGKKINYIGHSQGTLIMFIALSMKYQHIKENLATFVALGPIVYIKDMDSPLLNKLMDSKTFEILNKTGDKILLYMSDRQLRLQSAICTYDRSVCGQMLYQISDKNNSVNNLKRMPVITGHYPAGTSLKNFIQFEQYYHSGKFQMFDYGQDQNLKRYGSKQAPIYNISNIDVPVHFFVGKYDRLATIKDAQKLYSQLIHSPNKTYTELEFGHATFLWGKDMSFLDKVVQIIEQTSFELTSDTIKSTQ